MARGSIWISYDPRDDRRNSGRRRRWLWFLLVALIALVALGLIGFGVSQVDVPEIQLGQPVAIQEALPALVNDHSAIVYVVDDSGSMYVKLASLHEALKNLAEKSSENSEIALFQFGDAPRLLFDFTAPMDAPWDTRIPAFAAESGGTYLYAALREALDIMPPRPSCIDVTHWLFFKETLCKERRIVLMSDGIASDWNMAPDVLPDLIRSIIPVDTVALGDDADRKSLKNIADSTGGRFIEAYE